VEESEMMAGDIEATEGGRHERRRGTRVVTLELSRARIERLVAGGLLDDDERDDRTIGAAIKALIDGAAPTTAPVSRDGRELSVPVMLDPDEQAFLLESQLLPVHGSADRHGMARVFKKLLGDARAHWLQFNAPQRSATRVAAAAPLGTAALAAIEARHRAARDAAPPTAAPVRLVPRSAEGLSPCLEADGRLAARMGTAPRRAGNGDRRRGCARRLRPRPDPATRRVSAGPRLSRAATA
jgi:hypothetical protein